jgi:hypothetical protein
MLRFRATNPAVPIDSPKIHPNRSKSTFKGLDTESSRLRLKSYLVGIYQCGVQCLVESDA